MTRRRKKTGSKKKGLKTGGRLNDWIRQKMEKRGGRNFGTKLKERMRCENEIRHEGNGRRQL